MSSYFARDKVVKIRKPHRCHACLDKYQAGEKMVYAIGTLYGDFYSCYYCLCCHSYMQTVVFQNMEQGIDEGEFKGEVDYETFKANFKTKDI